MKQSLFIILLVLNIFSIYSQNPLKKKIEAVIEGKQATVGVAVIAGNDTVTVNNDHRYPMMSVFKFHGALAVLDYLNKNKISLKENILVSQSNLLHSTHSPMLDKYTAEKFTITVDELLRFSVSQSDNNACDLLFKLIGGTHRAQRYIKGLGIDSVSIAADEKRMHEKYENQLLNWTTPLETVKLLEIFRTRNILPKPHEDFLKTIMTETSTGNNKLKAGLPANTLIGHKTGSSFRHEDGYKVADNDAGFVQLADNRYYSIAVFITNSYEDDTTNAALIAEISKIVFEYYSEVICD